MKTSVNMVRKMQEFDVYQRTSDGYFNANKLLNQWNRKYNSKSKNINKFLSKDSTKEYIKQIQITESQQSPIEADGDFQVVKVIKGKYTKKGKIADEVWMHPYLFIDFCMWLSPKFKYYVMKFVYDQLVEYRRSAGDNYKKLCDAAFGNFKDISRNNIFKIPIALNYVVFNTHRRGIRQYADSNQMMEMNEIEDKLSFSIQMGYITSFKMLINEIWRLYYNKYKVKGKFKDKKV